MEVTVKKPILTALVVLATLGALLGCAGMSGKPRGPVDAFVFTTGANPGLEQNAVGALNMQPDPLEIMVVVPPGTNMRGLVATFSLNVEAAISTISSGAKVVQKNGVTPNDFSAPVMYTVEIPKVKKPWRYKVTVREAETNPRLSQLTLGDGLALRPSFSAKVKSYSVTVPFATKKLRIDARGEGQYMKSITIDGASSPGASASGSVDFSSGQEKSIVIETVAEDGVGRDEYEVLIVRGAPDRNANLEGLEIAGVPLVPGFSALRSSYQAQVPFSATQFVLKARPQSQFSTAALSAIVTAGKTQSRAALAYKGDPVEKAGATVDFSMGDRLGVVVSVTAQDGGVQEYLVDVVRAEPEHTNTLAVLSVTGARMTPAFSPSGLSYAVDVPFASRTVTVIAQPQGRFAKVVLEPGPGTAQGATEIPYKGDPASKTGSAFDFSTADRLSLIAAVTAQDGKVLRYFLDVRRAPPDSNADMAGLAVSAGILSPLFTPRMVSYTVSLPSNAETVKLTLTTASPVATVGADQPVAQSGATWVITVPAPAGKVLPVNVTITAEDGSQRLYRVNVSREALHTGREHEAGDPPAHGRLTRPGVRPGGRAVRREACSERGIDRGKCPGREPRGHCHPRRNAARRCRPHDRRGPRSHAERGGGGHRRERRGGSHDPARHPRGHSRREAAGGQRQHPRDSEKSPPGQARGSGAHGPRRNHRQPGPGRRPLL
jgi:hypothetical protein